MSPPQIDPAVVRKEFPELTNDFIGMMSHEFFTPLNSVIGLADLLSASELTGRQREHLNELRSSGKALRRLFEDVLDYICISSGNCAIDRSEVDVWRVLEEVRDFYRPLAMEKGLLLSMRLEETAPLVAMVDREKLRQALGNLVGNAIKFTERGAIAVIASSKWNRDRTKFRVRVEVRDTGIGIPAEHFDTVFEPFTQLDVSRSRTHGGSGLGLAICRRLALLMAGEAGVKESSPQGTTFYFSVELDSVSRPVRTRRLLVTNKAPFARVLVVDDHRINRLLARHILSDIGIEVDEAENGLRCMEMHALSAYDLILMDIQMPKIDGIETTRLIRQAELERRSKKKARIVAVTAHTLAGIRQQLFEAGIDHCLTKPLNREDLEAVLYSDRDDA